jgi:hypothetical protein
VSRKRQQAPSLCNTITRTRMKAEGFLLHLLDLQAHAYRVRLCRQADNHDDCKGALVFAPVPTLWPLGTTSSRRLQQSRRTHKRVRPCCSSRQDAGVQAEVHIFTAQVEKEVVVHAKVPILRISSAHTRTHTCTYTSVYPNTHTHTH